MTIEHKTTHGPHGAGQLAADWMLESGKAADRIYMGPELRPHEFVRLAAPHQDMALTLESAAALRDALSAHLVNMGHEFVTVATDGTTVRVDSKVHGALEGWFNPAPAPADAVEVAEHIRDAYADNSRTIDARDVGGMTDQEAAEALADVRIEGRGYKDGAGILYTSAAVRELEVKAARHRRAPEGPRVPTDAQLEHLAKDVLAHMEEDALESPVTAGGGLIRAAQVRAWSNKASRGAWNHLMEASGPGGLDTDRPTGRHYTALASIKLRQRLNEINGADADRG